MLIYKASDEGEIARGSIVPSSRYCPMFYLSFTLILSAFPCFHCTSSINGRGGAPC